MTTATTLSQPTTPAAKAIMNLYHIGLAAGAGALAGLAFGIINPIGGAIFGAAATTANWIGRTVTDSLPIEDAGAKTALEVVAFVLSLGLGIIAVTYAGFTLTAMGAIGMVFAMVLTKPIAECTANCFANRSNGML